MTTQSNPGGNDLKVTGDPITMLEAVSDVAEEIRQATGRLSDSIGGHMPIWPKTGFIAHPELKPIESVAEAIVFTGEAIDRQADRTLQVANSISEAGADIAAAIEKLARAIEYAASPQD